MSKLFDVKQMLETSPVYVVNGNAQDNNPRLFSWGDHVASEHKLPPLDLLIQQAKAIGALIENNPGVCSSPETKAKIVEILGYK